MKIILIPLFLLVLAKAPSERFQTGKEVCFVVATPKPAKVA